jgi:hypothetical protein
MAEVCLALTSVDRMGLLIRISNSGEWGSLPLAGGIEVGHSFELKELERKEGVEARNARYRELDEEYRLV